MLSMNAVIPETQQDKKESGDLLISPCNAKQNTKIFSVCVLHTLTNIYTQAKTTRTDKKWHSFSNKRSHQDKDKRTSHLPYFKSHNYSL